MPGHFVCAELHGQIFSVSHITRVKQISRAKYAAGGPREVSMEQRSAAKGKRRYAARRKIVEGGCGGVALSAWSTVTAGCRCPTS